MKEIDTIREALEELRGLIDHIERTTGHKYDRRKLDAALDAISIIDPDAIRRKCAEIADAVLDRQGFKLGKYELRSFMRSAILGTEPAREESE